jgi:sporulation protein YlmC with PRC-barrel domain
MQRTPASTPGAVGTAGIPDGTQGTTATSGPGASPTGPTDGTVSAAALISSDRVQGTEVYDLKGTHIGEINSLIIDKVSGRVVYAMMSFGGFMGMGKRYYPVPWAALYYDLDQGGYRAELTEEQVRGAPEYNADGTIDQFDANMHRRLHDHYAVRGWWDGAEVVAPDASKPGRQA